MSLSAYSQLIRMEKPIGTWLLAWPAAIGLWLAYNGGPPMGVVMVFAAGVFLMRSAGCVLNDLTDQKFDARVARTKSRPLAAGVLSRQQGITILVLLLLAAASLLLALPLAAVPLCLASLGVAIIYPWMKRITHYPQVVLAVAFVSSVPIAFASAGKSMHGYHWMTFAALMTWIVAFDVIYAMMDVEDDIKIGVKSPAVHLGDNTKFLVVGLHVVMLVFLFTIGDWMKLHPSYYIGVMLAGFSCSYQHILIWHCSKDRALRAFKSNQYTGLLMFFAFQQGINPFSFYAGW